MVPICICELSFFDYFIRIGNFFVLVYFLLYFIENKFLVWLRKEEEWTVIDRQMLDTLFDNNEKSEVEEVPELEQEIVAEAASEEASEAVVEAASEEASEAVVEAEVTEALETVEASEEASEEALMEEQEASKILDETEIVDLLMN